MLREIGVAILCGMIGAILGLIITLPILKGCGLL